MNMPTETGTRRHAPGTSERIALWSYLLRVDWRLSRRGIGWNHRKQIHRELKANVLEAAADDGALRRTLEGLGSPAELADGYADPISQRGVLHHAAAAWALAAMAVLQAVGIAIAVGFQHGAEAAGVDRTVNYAFEFVAGFGPYVGSYTPDPTSAEFMLISPAHLVIMLAAALTGGRIWRLLTR